MFEFIAEILAWLPSDVEFGTMQAWLSDWVATHLIISVILYEALKVIVKKTPWMWDNKALDWIKAKIWKKADA